MNLLIKTLIGIACSILVSLVAFAEDKDRDYSIYAIFGGGKNISEEDDLDTGIGEGSSVRFNLGVQFTNRFGLEIFGEMTSAMAAKTVLAELENTLVQPLVGYRIKTKGTKYIGGLGIFSFKPKFFEPSSVVAKVGLARYEARRLSGRLQYITVEQDDAIVVESEFDWQIKGFTPIVALGIEFPFNWPRKMSGQVLWTHMFHEDARSFTVGCNIKYTF